MLVRALSPVAVCFSDLSFFNLLFYIILLLEMILHRNAVAPNVQTGLKARTHAVDVLYHMTHYQGF